MADLRIDKWLWAARLYKTRAQAAEDLAKGRVSLNGAAVKASREPKIGDRLQIRHAGLVRSFTILGLSALRGPAPVAQLLYAETAESVAARERANQARRQGVEPADSLDSGRPTKRNRRVLADWQRWRASVDDLPTPD